MKHTLGSIISSMMIAQQTDATKEKCAIVIDNGVTTEMVMMSRPEDEHRSLQVVFFACGHEVRIVMNPFRGDITIPAVNQDDKGIMHESFLGVYIDGELIQNIAQANESWAGDNVLFASLFQREGEPGMQHIVEEPHLITKGDGIMAKSELVALKHKQAEEYRAKNPTTRDKELQNNAG